MIVSVVHNHKTETLHPEPQWQTVLLSVGKVEVLAFANFGSALRSTEASTGTSSKKGTAVLDYSQQELSTSADARDKVSKRICYHAMWHPNSAICGHCGQSQFKTP